MNQVINMQDNRGLIEAAFEKRNTITPESGGADLLTATEASIFGLERGELRGAFIGHDAVLMPSYANIGARVGERTRGKTSVNELLRASVE